MCLLPCADSVLQGGNEGLAAAAGMNGSLFTAGGGSLVSVQSQHLADLLDHLYDQQIAYTCKIQHEHGRVEDLRQRLKRVHRDLEERRKASAPGSLNVRKGGVSPTEREIQKLENKLQLALTKGSLLESANKKLRVEVDSVRRKKVSEQHAKRRLEEELTKSKIDCADMVRRTQQMHDDKEKTRREIELLKQDVVHDLETFQDEFDGMVEHLTAAGLTTQESNAKLEGLMRNRSLTASPSVATAAAAGSSLDAGGSLSAQNHSVQLRQQSNQAYWTILKKKNDLMAKASRAQELENILDTISAATEPAALEDFVPIMLEAEDENYSLFKLINELNKELEELDADKGRVTSEISTLTRHSRKSDQQQMKAELQHQIVKARAKAEDYDAAYRRDLDVIKSVEESLTSVFNKVGLSDEAMSKQLLTMGLTERNVLLFLGLIEQQIEHIVQVYNAATDSAPTAAAVTEKSNSRRPGTANQIDPTTGKRFPSLRAPHPPSSEAIDELLEVNTGSVDDGATAVAAVAVAAVTEPVDISKIAASMREAVLQGRMPLGTAVAGSSGKASAAQLATASVTSTQKHATISTAPVSKLTRGSSSTAVVQQQGSVLSTGKASHSKAKQ
jgi:hypothetical protein